MKLTDEQALQKGIIAHKAGDLQEAERIYRGILKKQPLHPDANHNLGILAVTVDKADLALSFFEAALNENPKVEQFWISYIEALIREKKYQKARELIEQGKLQGVSKERLTTLEWKFIYEMETFTNENSSHEQLTNLLRLYQMGQYDKAEQLARSISEHFPFQNFSWKILAAVLKKTGNLSLAVPAGQKAVEINSHDAEAHSNLGIALQELGRLAEAESSHKQAIGLKPDFAEAHNNMGVTLQEQGRLNEAKTSYMQALALKPDFTQVYYNMGFTLKEVGRLVEAKICFAQATALQPDHDEANNNLLKCLYLLDRETFFFDQLDRLIGQGKSNAVIGSLTCRSALKYGVEKPNPFCKAPLEYVLHVDLNCEYDFKKTFADNAKSILCQRKTLTRQQTLLVNGYQTGGNLFDLKNSLVDEIEKAIHLEIKKYQQKFNTSEEGLIKKWPIDYSLYGWLISMKSGGELQPHIHDRGWLSGSLYINVPEKTKAQSGDLVVALGEKKDVADGRENIEKVINVETGSLVLFPASLTHYTIPFQSEEERIVLAFDVIKK